jgi:hypothetical protein
VTAPLILPAPAVAGRGPGSARIKRLSVSRDGLAGTPPGKARGDGDDRISHLGGPSFLDASSSSSISSALPRPEAGSIGMGQ